MSQLTNSRFQLAINVSNLEEAVEFYSRYFNTQPAKVRAGYANFAITDPPLKLVLMETADGAGSINHLGVEFPSTDSVIHEVARLTTDGLVVGDVDNTTCCFAVQDKAWVDGPDGIAWESYTVLADADVMHENTSDATACCAPTSKSCC